LVNLINTVYNQITRRPNIDKNVNYDAFTKAALKGTLTNGGYTISRA